MAATIPTEGRLEWDKYARDVQSSWRVMLFSNNVAISSATVYSDMAEATYSGYARQTPSFGALALNGASAASMVAGALTFSHNGGGTSNTIYGWALIDSVDNKVLAIDNVPSAPKTMAASGDTITVTFTQTLTQA